MDGVSDENHPYLYFHLSSGYIFAYQSVAGPDEKSCPLTIRLNQDGTFTCEFSTNLVRISLFCYFPDFIHY